MAKAKAAAPVKHIAQAQMQAWVVNLITLVANAYDGGLVLGSGAQLGPDKTALSPDVLLLAPDGRADDVLCPVLAVSVLDKDTKAEQRQSLITRYAEAGVYEYWQISVDAGRVWLLQRSADGQLEEIPPDQQGLHYAMVLTELVFPIAWFMDQPDMWEMMDWWGLIDEADEGAG